MCSFLQNRDLQLEPDFLVTSAEKKSNFDVKEQKLILMKGHVNLDRIGSQKQIQFKKVISPFSLHLYVGSPTSSKNKANL